MAETEKREILDALKSGRDALGEALAGVGETLAARKPSSGGWSILECVEHVAVSERFLVSRLAGATRSGCSHEDRKREAMIVARSVDRAVTRESPEAGRPANRYASLSGAVAAVDSARAETVKFVEGSRGDLRFWIADHPLIPGPVNCYEMLLVIAAHPARHAKQIAEIRAALA